MREILFRGKFVGTGEWVYGSLLTDIYGSYPCILRNANIDDDSKLHFDFTPVELSTIFQYTGLKDKNGTRIFEGDIIKINGLDGDYLFEVKFGKCGGVQNVVHEVGYVGFYLYPISKSAQECENFGLRNDILYWENRDGGVLVVGNVHDNPELLENSQNFS